ncbi:MAG: MarR family winged helix-turn-helix transcriptional regulator [Hyphomonadaceae bacterium]
MPPPSPRAKSVPALSGEAFDIGFLLADVMRLTRVAFDRHMRALGVTGATWRIIAYLSRSDGRTQIELARQLDVSRVAIGQMIDRLEKSGHVERRADPRDRRVWRIYLTDKAHEITARVLEASRGVHAQMYEGADTASLKAGLTRLRDNLAAGAQRGKRSRT